MLLQTLTPFYVLCAGILGAHLPASEVAIEDVMEDIESGLKFFNEDYSSINVDGLFGLRLGQGQLKEAIRECWKKSCDKKILKKLTSLDERLGTTCDSALPYVEASDTAYYNRFISFINKPYIMPYSPTSFDEGDGISVGTITLYDEELGDICYSRMMGTFEENNMLLPRCNITQGCWDYMTTDETAGYTITHQLLYFIIIDHVGCREAVDNFTRSHNVQKIQQKLCSKIYAEAKTMESHGKVMAHKHDLFLEQTVLCGPLGFENFMRPDWMKMILTWPDKKDGCFKFPIIEAILEDEEESKLLSESHEKQRRIIPKEERSSRMTMRKLLREQEMRDGCLSHTSGLGFGVLCTYLRYLLRLV